MQPRVARYIRSRHANSRERWSPDTLIWTDPGVILRRPFKERHHPESPANPASGHPKRFVVRIDERRSRYDEIRTRPPSGESCAPLNGPKTLLQGVFPQSCMHFVHSCPTKNRPWRVATWRARLSPAFSGVCSKRASFMYGPPAPCRSVMRPLRTTQKTCRPNHFLPLFWRIFDLELGSLFWHFRFDMWTGWFDMWRGTVGISDTESYSRRTGSLQNLLTETRRDWKKFPPRGNLGNVACTLPPKL